MNLTFAAPSADTQILVFEQMRDGSLKEFIVAEPWSAHMRFGYEGCELLPVAKVGEAYCGRLVAYDVAGNSAGRDVEVCAETIDCRPALLPDAICAPAEDCIPVEPDLDDREPTGACSSGNGAGTGLGLFGALALLIRRRRAARH